jgi:hypothetical protein
LYVPAASDAVDTEKGLIAAVPGSVKSGSVSIQFIIDCEGVEVANRYFVPLQLCGSVISVIAERVTVSPELTSTEADAPPLIVADVTFKAAEATVGDMTSRLKASKADADIFNKVLYFIERIYASVQ